MAPGPLDDEPTGWAALGNQLNLGHNVIKLTHILGLDTDHASALKPVGFKWIGDSTRRERPDGRDGGRER